MDRVSGSVPGEGRARRITDREAAPAQCLRRAGRHLFGALLAVVLAVNWSASARAQEDLAAIEKAARQEGPMTWYVSFYGADLAEMAVAAFSKKYPGLVVKPVRATTGGIFQRVNQDLRANNPVAGVLSMSGIGDHYGILLRGKSLASYVPANASKIIATARPAIVEGYVYPFGGGLMAMAYNNKLVSAADAPKAWADMADPKWKGKLAVGHPGFSGFDAALVAWLSKAKGWDYFKAVRANDPLVQRSTFDSITSLNSGERLVAPMPDGVAAPNIDKGNPIAVVYPTDGSLFIMGLTAIMKNAPQPNMAKLFTEFLLGEEHAQILVTNNYDSVRGGVARTLVGGKRMEDINVVPLLPSAEYAEQLKTSTEQWREIFGG
ncbi:MAG: ABC transporter substrate-binding protein [Bacteroidota bacterium]|jgi:iron(III) transport system substrate-binding protein